MYEFEDYTINCSLNTNEIYFYVMNVKNYKIYEDKMTIHHFNLHYTLKQIYMMIIKCFENNSLNYKYLITTNKEHIKILFEVMLDDIIDVKFNIDIKESIMSDKQCENIKSHNMEKQIKRLEDYCLEVIKKGYNKNITIAIAGFPNVGKSTIINSFIGDIMPRIYTEKETVFKISNDNDTYTKKNMIKTHLEEGIDVVLKSQKDFYLGNKYNFTFIGNVGIEDNKIEKDKSFIELVNNKMWIDIFIIVFDIHTVMYDINHCQHLIKSIGKEVNRNGKAKVIIILNKCDNMVYGKKSLDSDSFVIKSLSDNEKNIIEKIKDIFKDICSSVIPLCAEKTRLLSTGKNGNFINMQDEEKYIGETEYGSADKLLNKFGFMNLIHEIKNHIENREDEIISNQIKYYTR
jgi:GTPase SAR1 family protein